MIKKADLVKLIAQGKAGLSQTLHSLKRGTAGKGTYRILWAALNGSRTILNQGWSEFVN